MLCSRVRTQASWLSPCAMHRTGLRAVVVADAARTVLKSRVLMEKIFPLQRDYAPQNRNYAQPPPAAMPSKVAATWAEHRTPPGGRTVHTSLAVLIGPLRRSGEPSPAESGPRLHGDSAYILQGDIEPDSYCLTVGWRQCPLIVNGRIIRSATRPLLHTVRHGTAFSTAPSAT